MSSTESSVFLSCAPNSQLESLAKHSAAQESARGPSKEALLRIIGMIATLLGRAERSTPRSPQGRAFMRAGLTAKVRAEP
jgi:hypothetical protein